MKVNKGERIEYTGILPSVSEEQRIDQRIRDLSAKIDRKEGQGQPVRQEQEEISGLVVKRDGGVVAPTESESFGDAPGVPRRGSRSLHSPIDQTSSPEAVLGIFAKADADRKRVFGNKVPKGWENTTITPEATPDTRQATRRSKGVHRR